MFGFWDLFFLSVWGFFVVVGFGEVLVGWFVHLFSGGDFLVLFYIFFKGFCRTTEEINNAS